MSLDFDALLAGVEGSLAVSRKVQQRLREITRSGRKPSQIMDQLRRDYQTLAMRTAWAAYRADPGDTHLAAAWDNAAARAPVEYKYVESHRGEILVQIRNLLGLPPPPTTLARRELPARSVPEGIKTRKVWADWPEAARAALFAQLMGPPVPRPPQAVSVFSGGGLYDLALFLEGIEVQETAEIEPRAVETLRANLHPRAVPTDALLWTPTATPVDGLDILTGGPPCQPFSQGRNLGRGYGPAGPADPRNMYPRVLDWVADSTPRIVCLENSAQLAKDPEYRTYIDWWFSQLDALGYAGTLWVISAASYGTPQARWRAWAVAWPKGASWGSGLRTAPPATHGRPGTKRVESGELLPWTRAFDRLNSGCCAGYGLTTCNNLGNRNGRCATCVAGVNYDPAPNYNVNEMRANLTQAAVKGASSWKDPEAGWGAAEEKTGALRIQSFRPVAALAATAWEQLKTDAKRLTRYLAPTVTVRILKGAPYGLLVPEGADPWGSVDRYDRASVEGYVSQLKQMSVRDAAKLQDVPQWYRFEGPRTEQYRQIGNGIPVNMGRAVAAHLLRALDYPTPLPDSVAAQSLRGLWPLDRVDICASFPGLLGYADALPFHAWRQKPRLTTQQRRRRPFPTSEEFQAMKRARQQVGRRVAAIHPQATRQDPRFIELGYWKSQRGGAGQMAAGQQIYVHDPTWVPQSSLEPPPGFADLNGFLHWVQAQDPAVVNHYRAVYHQAMPQDWPETTSGPFPQWSPFHPQAKAQEQRAGDLFDRLLREIEEEER